MGRGSGTWDSKTLGLGHPGNPGRGGRGGRGIQKREDSGTCTWDVGTRGRDKETTPDFCAELFIKYNFRCSRGRYVLSFFQLVSVRNSPNPANWSVLIRTNADRHSGWNLSSWYIFVKELAVIVYLSSFLHFHRRLINDDKDTLHTAAEPAVHAAVKN